MTEIDQTAKRWTATLRRLVDPALVTYYNRLRRVWVVDRCTNPESSSLSHTCSPACLKSNVLVLAPGEPPSDRTVAKLKSMDTWREFGRDKAPEAMLRLDDHTLTEDQERRKQKIDQNWAHIRRDNHRQLRKAWHLIQQHDMTRIHN